MAANGECVQQRLGGMFVGAVAGIDDAAIEFARQKFRRARILMAHHQYVGPHGIEGGGGVEQGLALGDRRRLTDMFITSAPSRLPASSKEDWVRVLDSKNRLIRVRPLSRAVFLSVARP